MGRLLGDRRDFLEEPGRTSSGSGWERGWRQGIKEKGKGPSLPPTPPANLPAADQSPDLGTPRGRELYLDWFGAQRDRLRIRRPSCRAGERRTNWWGEAGTGDTHASHHVPFCGRQLLQGRGDAGQAAQHNMGVHEAPGHHAEQRTPQVGDRADLEAAALWAPS